jgi:hypothetical protein
VTKGSGHIKKHSNKFASPIRVPSIFCRRIASETANEIITNGGSSQYVMKSSKKIGLSTTMPSTATPILSANKRIDNDNNKPSTPASASKISSILNRKLLNRNRSVKRLNNTVTSGSTGSAAAVCRSPGKVVFSNTLPRSPFKIQSDGSFDTLNDDDDNNDDDKENSTQLNSPTSKQLIISTELKCTNESIDL